MDISDENGCKVTTVPPVADTNVWIHPSLPHALGNIFSMAFHQIDKKLNFHDKLELSL